MSNVVLAPEEFAYLLAVVRAPLLVGVNDSRLFPKAVKARKAVFGKGRELLERNGWLKALAEAPGEYEFDPALMEMVASMADPDFVIGVVRKGADGKYVGILDYLAPGLIIELTIDIRGGYRLGTVADRTELFKRMGLILRLTTPNAWGQFNLDEKVFRGLQSLAQNGNSGQAQELLKSNDVSSATAHSLLQALASPKGGMVVGLRPAWPGGAETGRKASVYGELGAAWFVQKPGRDSTEVEVTSCDTRRLELLVNAWLEELAQPQVTAIARVQQSSATSDTRRRADAGSP